MKMINTTDRTLKFSIRGQVGDPAKEYVVQPGECCDVPDGYCKEVGGRCIIKMKAPGLEPYTEEKAPKKEKKPEPKPEVAEEVPSEDEPKQSKRKYKAAE